MLTLVFTILMFWIFGKLIMLSVRAAWGLSKIVCTLVILPVVLIALVIGGLVWLALPLLAFVGIITLFVRD